MVTRSFIMRCIVLAIMLVPLLTLAQHRDKDVKALHREIDELSKMIDQLKAEQAKAYQIENEIKRPHPDYTRRDSLRLVKLRRKQAESRARIDHITLEILKLSRALQDPGKRFALAKRMKLPPRQVKAESQMTTADTSIAMKKITPRSIDLAAVKLVRSGKSLDQARLLTIESLKEDQVLAFYKDLDKSARYELYDIADEIVISEGVKLEDARRSAIYFYLFAQ